MKNARWTTQTDTIIDLCGKREDTEFQYVRSRNSYRSRVGLYNPPLLLRIGHPGSAIIRRTVASGVLRAW